jgi:hypothetical protein
MAAVHVLLAEAAGCAALLAREGRLRGGAVRAADVQEVAQLLGV